MNKRQEHRHICDLNLHAQGVDAYGTAYQDHFLEQYKIVIQGIDYTSKWKHIVNNYFLTIHTLLLAAIGFSVVREQISIPVVAHQIVPVIGVVMAIAWWITARGYNEVLEAKFSILHCIEEELPLALYKTEWEILGAFYKNPNRLARVDAAVPLIFATLYLLVFFFVK
ncbi:MAG: RipA family octameric membrane protein [Minisyncoccota bacterium]